MAPLDNIEDCTTIEIPVTFVVTYDNKHEWRVQFATNDDDTQTAVMRERVERIALAVVEQLNALDAEDIVFGVRIGGSE